jgi:hypothetical protein
MAYVLSLLMKLSLRHFSTDATFSATNAHKVTTHWEIPRTFPRTSEHSSGPEQLPYSKSISLGSSPHFVSRSSQSLISKFQDLAPTTPPIQNNKLCLHVALCLTHTYFSPFWRNSPARTRAASFFRFLYHTPQSVTPLDERSARRWDLYLTTHNTHKRQTSIPLVGIRTRNPRKRSAADPRLRPLGVWDRRPHVQRTNKIKRLSREFRRFYCVVVGDCSMLRSVAR